MLVISTSFTYVTKHIALYRIQDIDVCTNTSYYVGSVWHREEMCPNTSYCVGSVWHSEEMCPNTSHCAGSVWHREELCPTVMHIYLGSSWHLPFISKRRNNLSNNSSSLVLVECVRCKITTALSRFFGGRNSISANTVNVTSRLNVTICSSISWLVYFTSIFNYAFSRNPSHQHFTVCPWCCAAHFSKFLRAFCRFHFVHSEIYTTVYFTLLFPFPTDTTAALPDRFNNIAVQGKKARW